MERKYQTKDQNVKNMTSLVLLTAIFGVASVFFGYFALPLAAASYAALLLFENKNRRIMSYVLPVAIAFFDFSLNWVNGYFSEQSIAYVAVGIIIYLCYTKKSNMTFCTVLLAAVITLFLVIGILFLGFNQADSAGISALLDVAKNAYYQGKDAFISTVTSITAADDAGVIYVPVTREYAEVLFHIILQVIPAAVIVVAFFLSAITLKFFTVITRGKIRTDDENQSWIFKPSKITCCFYIAVALLNSLIFGTDVFTVTVYNVYLILLSVFACLGVKFLYLFITQRKSPLFAIGIILVSVLLLGTTALALISYLGVYFGFTSNKKTANSDL